MTDHTIEASGSADRFYVKARVLTINLSVIHLFSVPFSTALGIHGLWVLLQRETEPPFKWA